MASKRPDSLTANINPQDLYKYLPCITCKEIKENSKILLCGHTICVACLGDAANSRNFINCSSCNTDTSFPYKSPMKLQNNFLAMASKEFLSLHSTKGANDLSSPVSFCVMKAKSPHVLLIKSLKYVECCKDVIRQTEDVHTKLNDLQKESIKQVEKQTGHREEREKKILRIKSEFEHHLKTLKSPQQTAKNTITRILQISKLLQISKELKIDPGVFVEEEPELKDKLKHAFSQVDNLRASLSTIRNFYQVTLRTPQEIVEGVATGESFNLLGTEVRVCQRIGGPEYLSNPVAVGICNSLERVYILDWDKLQVVVFTWTGDFVIRFGRKGELDGEFTIPHNICVLRDLVLITDWYKNNIQVFTKQGEFLLKFGKYGRGVDEFDAPSGLAMCHEEHNLFVADYLNNRVQVYTMREDGHFDYLDSLGVGVLRGPMDVGTHAGQLFVLDDNSPCIHVFNYNGDLSGEFCYRNPSQSSSVNFPWYMAIDGKSNIVLSDRDGHKVCIFNKAGELQQSFRTKDARNWKFKDPAGIAISRQGKIYICDCYNACLQAY